MLSKWFQTGFHVFCGNRISPNDETAMENLRASFSQERVDSLWCSQIPNTVEIHHIGLQKGVHFSLFGFKWGLYHLPAFSAGVKSVFAGGWVWQ